MPLAPCSRGDFSKASTVPMRWAIRLRTSGSNQSIFCCMLCLPKAFISRERAPRWLPGSLPFTRSATPALVAPVAPPTDLVPPPSLPALMPAWSLGPSTKPTPPPVAPPPEAPGLLLLCCSAWERGDKLFAPFACCGLGWAMITSLPTAMMLVACARMSMWPFIASNSLASALIILSTESASAPPPRSGKPLPTWATEELLDAGLACCWLP
mmetsp:Transcript_24290/g.62698  ORF Transcript_24290/g.62698 Transcript_24290/m.62698 type:complete len:211 (-) Transcript_24290:2692-3324(-)